MSNEEDLYAAIDQLQDELITAMHETVQLLKDKQALAEENGRLKKVITNTLDELMPDKIYGYVHESIYEANGSAGLSKDGEAYKGSGTHIPLYKFPMSILKACEVTKNG